MNADPDKQVCLEDFYAQLQGWLGHKYPRVPQDDISEAVQVAMNTYCTSVPPAVKGVPAALFSWLRTIAQRHLWLELRRRKRVLAVGDMEEATNKRIHEYDDDTASLACASSVMRLLRVLTPVTARVVWLHDIEHWKPSEIAGNMGCSTDAVNHRIKRAHVLLRRMLRNEVRIAR